MPNKHYKDSSREVEKYEVTLESVAFWKKHRKRSEVARSPDFVKELHNVRKDPGKGIGWGDERCSYHDETWPE